MQKEIMIQKLEDDYIHLSVFFFNENRRKWYKTAYQTSKQKKKYLHHANTPK